MRAGTPQRHRALEGVLLRLARQPDQEAFALRGGMRIRQLFPTHDRPASDVDLVWRAENDQNDITRRLQRALSADVADGVRFQTRLRVDAMQVRGTLAGYRCIARGMVDDLGLDVLIDVRTDLSPRSTHELLKVERGAGALLMCRPETLVGRKLQVIAEAGRQRWRPKDLLDVGKLLEGAEITDVALECALHESFEHAGEIEVLHEALRSDAWWGERSARMRWRRATRRPLDSIVAALRARSIGGMLS